MGGTQGQAFEGSAAKAGQGFRQNQQTMIDAFNQAQGDLTTGSQAAINTLRNVRPDIVQGGETARGDIASGVGGAQGAFGQARDAFGQAGDRFAGLENISGSFSPARETLLGGLGLRGPEGTAAAREAFAGSFQPEFEFNQGLEAINRARAARGAGTISGGNIDRDTQLFGQNLANSRTNQFLDRLTGLTDREIGTAGSAAAGRSAADTGIAGMFGQEAGTLERGGLSQAQVAQNTAQRLADLARGVAPLQQQEGQNLADLAIGRGQTLAGLQDQQTQNQINALLGRAGAKSAGAGNVANLGASILEAIAGAAGQAVAGSGG